MLYHSEHEWSHGYQWGTRSYLDSGGSTGCISQSWLKAEVIAILLRMQTWPTSFISSVKTVSMPWTKVKIERWKIVSVDIWDEGLSTNKWPGHLKTKMLKTKNENLTFLNIVSISTRDLLLRTRIGSHTLYISFESYKSQRSAFDGERYHSEEWKSHKRMRAFTVNVLSQSSSTSPQYHTYDVFWFRNWIGLN